jgi:fructose-specific component phosphotransferase system IIB-like protein
VVRVLAHTQVRKVPIGQKKAHLMEIQVGAAANSRGAAGSNGLREVRARGLCSSAAHADAPWALCVVVGASRALAHPVHPAVDLPPNPLPS